MTIEDGKLFVVDPHKRRRKMREEGAEMPIAMTVLPVVARGMNSRRTALEICEESL